MNHETLEQAINQWLRENEKGIAHEHESAIAIHAFKDGASWLEQQAASNFGHFWESLSMFDGDRVKSIEAFCKEAWMGGKMASAKLLAEKDAEIERLKLHDIAGYQEGIDCLTKELVQAKELIREMRETYDRIGHPMEFLNVGKFLHENADKIKALLGEE